MAAHRFDEMASYLSPDVERTGPYGDVYRGRDAYTRFLEGLLPALPGYLLEVERVTPAASAPLVFVELAETAEVDGEPRRTPEALVFELNDQGLIARVAVYIQAHPSARTSAAARSPERTAPSM